MMSTLELGSLYLKGSQQSSAAESHDQAQKAISGDDDGSQVLMILLFSPSLFSYDCLEVAPTQAGEAWFQASTKKVWVVKLESHLLGWKPLIAREPLWLVMVYLPRPLRICLLHIPVLGLVRGADPGVRLSGHPFVFRPGQRSTHMSP